MPGDGGEINARGWIYGWTGSAHASHGDTCTTMCAYHDARRALSPTLDCRTRCTVDGAAARPLRYDEMRPPYPLGAVRLAILPVAPSPPATAAILGVVDAVLEALPKGVSPFFLTTVLLLTALCALYSHFCDLQAVPTFTVDPSHHGPSPNGSPSDLLLSLPVFSQDSVQFRTTINRKSNRSLPATCCHVLSDRHISCGIPSHHPLSATQIFAVHLLWRLLLKYLEY